jgi:hypothetical protein
LASLIAAPGLLLAARFFSRRIKVASREKRRRAGSITTVAEESFSNPGFAGHGGCTVIVGLRHLGCGRARRGRGTDRVPVIIQ